MFGQELLDHDGKTPAALALEGKCVGIYFSARWCPSAFTPILIQFYKSLKNQKKPFEVVFVLKDGKQTEFGEYFAEMPWKAVPFGEESVRVSLSEHFKVPSVPTLILLDTDSSVITSEGHQAVLDDLDGDNFPWRANPTKELLSCSFVNKKGDAFQATDLAGKYVGVYFSGHWCQPCRTFTPKLIDCYNTLKSAGKHFEVIFVSHDKNRGQYKKFLDQMPWLALPFSDGERKKQLAKTLGVKVIPAFVMLDKSSERTTINSNARSAVSGDVKGVQFPWVAERPLRILPDGANLINERTCILALLDGCDKDERDGAIFTLHEIAADFKAEGDDLVFVAGMGNDEDIFTPQIRKLTKTSADAGVHIIILNSPAGVYHLTKVACVTKESVIGLIADFKANRTAMINIY